MKVQVNTDNLNLFKCLSSKTRIKIIELLNKKERNISELASKLGVSSAIITRHISELEKCNIVKSKNTPGKRGLQKICYISAEEITLAFQDGKKTTSEYHNVSLPVGQYTDYEIQPVCGLASREGLIGINDDPRYFSSPDRFNASIIWFETGWVEYQIPGYIISARPIKSIEISLEICSEFPGFRENYPSDIYFYLNNIELGIWSSPGDFGEKKGMYTPDWWHYGTQYGLLKTIRITKERSMLDGIKLSDVNLKEISLKAGHDIPFRISAPTDTENPGGINIFGKGFGNYNQNIEVRVEY